jgi:hypothetical protein
MSVKVECRLPVVPSGTSRPVDVVTLQMGATILTPKIGSASFIGGQDHDAVLIVASVLAGTA